MRYNGKTVIYDLMTYLGLSDFYSLGGFADAMQKCALPTFM